ncbi:D-galactarolactone cycloisomerase (plasmid) [Caballeronia sp. SBC1]|uniref:mandelate racemase/muconate lactonizing enzyme family protein n=1 Tax=unclassified Caballeronia TaxID=2646786 RepID=UPI0013E171D6|nr:MULTISPECIES: mandelate racemase/muconate lactonizing enzyme family protein [unclassified Caballeronia]QIE30036.1 D-galactarolactone cycloisomerase [Caballeronia sp. SBC2]QIN67743.1 D-galactarolactone cycloisomerase [Caballeronia sp. SBC1]
MKIASIETTIVRLPFSHGGSPTGFGGAVWGTIDVLLVEVRTDEGLSGWGEAFGFNVNPATKAVIDNMITPLVLGANPVEIDSICETLEKKLHLFGRNGPVTYGISGVNIALWDLAGKIAGMPLYKLINSGANVSRLPAYASLLRYGNVQDVELNCSRALREGYRSLKLHEIEVANIEAARSAAGPATRLMVDTNCAWTFDAARNIANRLRATNLYWLEEPIWPPEDRASLAALRIDGAAPIAAGENVPNARGFADLLDARSLDFVQPSVIKCGGISEMLKIFALADSANVRIAPHSPYFGPGFLATLHLIAASGHDDVQFERLYVDLADNLYGDWIHPVEGSLRVPQGPGLGLDPDPDVIARFRD